MAWTVDLHPIFKAEFLKFAQAVKIELAAMIELLEEFGPELKRPHADTLNWSRYANMKELRFRADDGVWRVAYAFDPARQAILLVAGDKSGTSEKRFYRMLIQRADERFDEHLTSTRKK